MSFLSKLFRSHDQPADAENPPAADGAQPDDTAETAIQTDAQAQPAADEQTSSASAAVEAAPEEGQAAEALPWWEEVAAEPAPDEPTTRAVMPTASPADAERPNVPALDDDRSARTAGPNGETEPAGTQPLAADMPALVALRSQRGLAAAAQRDIGRIRTVNQDSVFALLTTLPREGSDITIGLFVVADGMGGHDGGEVASRIAVNTVAHEILAELILPALADNVGEALQPLIIAAVQQANRAIWEHAQMVGSDMGTTCTVALLLGHTLYIGHVGDSRAYLATPTGMRVLTSDHSAVGRLIQVGQLDASEARDHPLRSQLYRTVGQHPEVQVDFIYQPVGDATHLLLCSDGLWGLLDDEVLLDVLEHTSWPHDACRELIARANLAGGDDNISAVVVTLPAP